MRERLADGIRRLRFKHSIDPRPCTHVAAAEHASPVSETCASCDAHGIKPVKLRICLTCGTVGCCDSSPVWAAAARLFRRDVRRDTSEADEVGRGVAKRMVPT